MNVQATHVIPMLPVLTMKVLLTVNVIMGIMELDLIVLVSQFFIDVSKIFYFFYHLLFVNCIIFLTSMNVQATHVIPMLLY